jgi:predicted Rdx family selenoprotein
VSLGEELERELGVKPQLVKGDNGVLDVLVDGRLVFSKDRDGRYPAPGELARAIRRAG